jgi:hypothetical protein
VPQRGTAGTTVFGSRSGGEDVDKVDAKLVCLLAMVIAPFPAISPQSAFAERRPYTTANPFIWDNDSESDAFSLDLMMALAHTGKINLIGISESPHPWRTTSEDYQAIVNKATNSGWGNIPDAAWDLGPYYMTALSRPSNGSIDSTQPLDTAPARMIRDKVLERGTESRPVVVGTRGALTSVASAYLLAAQAGRGPEFARKMVLYAGIGADGGHVLNNYNEVQDEWAVYVCLQRLKVVLTEYTNADHNQPNFWALIDTLPNNEIGQYMKETKAGWPYEPYHGVGDEMAVLALLNPTQGNYFRNTERVSFDHWDSVSWSWGPAGPELPQLERLPRLPEPQDGRRFG